MVWQGGIREDSPYADLKALADLATAESLDGPKNTIHDVRGDIFALLDSDLRVI